MDYSDSMVRFVVSRHLTSIGIYGSFMDTYKSGKPKYRKPKIVAQEKSSDRTRNEQICRQRKYKILALINRGDNKCNQQ